MRLPIVLLCCSLAGVLGGGALIGVWALGVCLIFCSLATGVWALFHDDGEGAQPQVHGIPADVQKFMDRVRGAA